MANKQSDLVQRNRAQSKRAQEVIARCQQLALFSEDELTTRRTFLSPPMQQCHRQLTRWMEPLGVQVRLDAVGNVRGFYPGTYSPRLIVGSHLDTIPDAGAYDGVLGVLLALTLLEALEGRKLPFGIEIVGFSEEEGVRFQTPFIGSRALVGRLDNELLNREDKNGITLCQAIQQFGLDPNQIPCAALSNDTLGYIEFHIEQGPILEELGYALGIVEAIVGQSRLEFTFTGRANHGGTTPMHLRHDAMAAAAQWITEVERAAIAVPGAVGTVGTLEAKPGVSNVIAGEVHLTLDVRHRSDEIRSQIVAQLIRKAEEISEHRRLRVRHSVLLSQQAVPMNGFLIDEIQLAIEKTGCVPHRMLSGAGHDAMILAEKVPAAMVFLRTPGGASHHPAESVTEGDVEKAIECGLHLLDQLAASPVFLKRMVRA
ncbi:MAG: allantoate amidohydrolase [Acidobacteria bacterium]|nr:allantoate amidohydrolase [Acidobacteriota bacterium]